MSLRSQRDLSVCRQFLRIVRSKLMQSHFFQVLHKPVLCSITNWEVLTNHWLFVLQLLLYENIQVLWDNFFDPNKGFQYFLKTNIHIWFFLIVLQLPNLLINNQDLSHVFPYNIAGSPVTNKKVTWIRSPSFLSQ